MKELLPRPFLKWVGGKRQLLVELLQAVDAAGPFKRYHEPFLGGGALFFALSRSGRLNSKSFLSDVNPNLIDAYKGVRDDVDGVIELLKKHTKRHNKQYFYKMRKAIPITLTERAARIIYLNKTCFNGLYRENSRGEFNAPMGSYKNPKICDEENLRAVSSNLQKVNVSARDFAAAAKQIRPGDLVYFDPPYNPVSKTSDFTGYAKAGFGADSQEALAKTFKSLAQKGVQVILSNSLTSLTEDLYSGFHIRAVLANRVVNSRADRRGKVVEAIVTNFPFGESSRRRKKAVNGESLRGIDRLERIQAKQWLLANNYLDIAMLIDEVTSQWQADGKLTRRNWWEVLAGDAKGNPRTVAGLEFPVLRTAQRRQGLPVTKNAICRSPNEGAPVVRVTRRRSKGLRATAR